MRQLSMFSAYDVCSVVQFIPVYRAGPDLAGGRPGAQWRIWDFKKGAVIPPIELRVLKIEGFGGRPPVGGRPGARGPRAPTKSGPAIGSTLSVFFKFV